ncbi:hypothetical protein EXIGLDRAFT_768851 [Exidia glandulosa HHB12029]|uniref:Uncharacterized protein n=1 Tax=Exidia glandulosa HHB12029 TaxID=1314781 RepID=A0A165HYD7_EXIGL|nr:hypothetical protein EXIGLDRAFT_768851 [Exidia glandulosa HHB12029]
MWNPDSIEFDAQEMRTKLDEAEKELLQSQESIHTLRKDYTRVAGERDAQKVELSFLHARLEKAETRARRESSANRPRSSTSSGETASREFEAQR